MKFFLGKYFTRSLTFYFKGVPREHWCLYGYQSQIIKDVETKDAKSKIANVSSIYLPQ